MSQENTKLCDFSNTKLCDFNTTLLNLVMKDQFSGTPNEDDASHLNSFVELRDMLKKKDVDNDVVKMKLFPFSLRDFVKI